MTEETTVTDENTTESDARASDSASNESTESEQSSDAGLLGDETTQSTQEEDSALDLLGNDPNAAPKIDFSIEDGVVKAEGLAKKFYNEDGSVKMDVLMNWGQNAEHALNKNFKPMTADYFKDSLKNSYETDLTETEGLQDVVDFVNANNIPAHYVDKMMPMIGRALDIFQENSQYSEEAQQAQAQEFMANARKQMNEKYGKNIKSVQTLVNNAIANESEEFKQQVKYSPEMIDFIYRMQSQGGASVDAPTTVQSTDYDTRLDKLQKKYLELDPGDHVGRQKVVAEKAKLYDLISKNG